MRSVFKPMYSWKFFKAINLCLKYLLRSSMTKTIRDSFPGMIYSKISLYLSNGGRTRMPAYLSCLFPKWALIPLLELST